MCGNKYWATLKHIFPIFHALNISVFNYEVDEKLSQSEGVSSSFVAAFLVFGMFLCRWIAGKPLFFSCYYCALSLPSFKHKWVCARWHANSSGRQRSQWFRRVRIAASFLGFVLQDWAGTTVLQRGRKQQFFLIPWHIYQPWAYATALNGNGCSSDIPKPPGVLPGIQVHFHETDGSINTLYIHHQVKARC